MEGTVIKGKSNRSLEEVLSLLLERISGGVFEIMTITSSVASARQFIAKANG